MARIGPHGSHPAREVPDYRSVPQRTDKWTARGHHPASKGTSPWKFQTANATSQLSYFWYSAWQSPVPSNLHHSPNSMFNLPALRQEFRWTPWWALCPPALARRLLLRPRPPSQMSAKQSNPVQCPCQVRRMTIQHWHALRQRRQPAPRADASPHVMWVPALQSGLLVADTHHIVAQQRFFVVACGQQGAQAVARIEHTDGLVAGLHNQHMDESPRVHHGQHI